MVLIGQAAREGLVLDRETFGPFQPLVEAVAIETLESRKADPRVDEHVVDLFWADRGHFYRRNRGQAGCEQDETQPRCCVHELGDMVVISQVCQPQHSPKQAGGCRAASLVGFLTAGRVRPPPQLVTN